MGLMDRFRNWLYGKSEQAAPKAPASNPTDKSKVTATKTVSIEQERGDLFRVKSRYDAAQTTDENRNHWSAADLLSANAANSAWVREKLRSRSRYECSNNGYAKGVIKSRTVDTIGTGPRLQLELPEDYEDPDFGVDMTTGDPEADASDIARQVERRWAEWCDAVNLTSKLRTLADAEDVDGEGFALITNNANLDGVQVDLRVIDCDRVTTPAPDMEMLVDGIELDENGNPTFYHVMYQHPGDMLVKLVDPLSYQIVPAAQVIHLFEQDRPEQMRGIPILTPALPLYAILRRYTLATLGAAELGAMIAGVIENTNGPADDSGDSAPEFEAMDAIPFARNALLTLAGGQTAKAFDSKNPNTAYREFKSEVLTEAGRAAQTPRNVATGSSAEYNFASGRLDLLPEQRAIRCRRERFERTALDRIFKLWLTEASLIPGYLPDGLPPVEEWEWCWMWDGFDFIDPAKEANANQVMLDSGQSTLKRVCAERGDNWVDVLKQRAREKALMDKLGLTPKPPVAAPAAAKPVAEDEEVDPEEEPVEDDADAA